MEKRPILVYLFIVGLTKVKKFRYELRQWRHQLQISVDRCKPRNRGSLCGWCNC